MRKTNYHTHTTRCNHAKGSDEDYVKRAIEGGYEVLGFSDHSPWPLLPFESSQIRMELSELPDYVASINSLKAKYEGQIKIYLGLECEYFENRIEWLKGIKAKYNFDYFILGNHYYEKSVSDRYYGRFAYNPEKIIEYYMNDIYKGLKSGVFDIVAHPDLFIRGWRKVDEKAIAAFEQLCKWSLEFDVPLEYNLNGLNYSPFYPNAELFELAAKYQAKVIMNADCHDPDDLIDYELYERGLANLKGYGCNIIEDIL